MTGANDKEQRIHDSGLRLTPGHTSVGWKGGQNCLCYLKWSQFQFFFISRFPYLVLFLSLLLFSFCQGPVVDFHELISL